MNGKLKLLVDSNLKGSMPKFRKSMYARNINFAQTATITMVVDLKYNKMTKKFKMSARHAFSIIQSILMQKLIKIWK
jgi:hypothetical protein